MGYSSPRTATAVLACVVPEGRLSRGWRGDQSPSGRLVDQGNTVIMIEHNLEFLANSDWVIQLGPRGGKNGGQIVYEGTPKDMLEADTVTAKWLRQAIEGNK